MAYANRGNAYRRRNELEKAILNYSASIELNPEFTQAYVNRGNVYCDSGDMDKAIIDYTHVIKLQPKVPHSYYARGEARLHIEKWEEAQRDLTAAMLQGVSIAETFHNTYGSIKAFEKEIGVKLPEDIVNLLTLWPEPLEIDRETRIALAMKYYESRELSSGLAARLAGISRAEFILLMADYGLSPLGTAEELRESGF